MNGFDKLLFDLVISIVSPIIVTYVTRKNIDDKSVFYSYITIYDEEFVKKCKIKSCILFIILFSIHFIFLYNNYIYTLPVNSIISNTIKKISTLLLSFLTIGQIILNKVIVFGDIKLLDKKIQKRPIDYSSISNYLYYIIILVYLVALIINFISNFKSEYLIVELIILLYITIGVAAAYFSFISLYVKFRRWYYVDEINIRTKSNKKIYSSIFNYKRISDTYEFVYEDEKVLKRIIIPSDDLESIEKTINTQKPFLKFMRENTK